ncbi:Com family DNA-binding transcriptional regulator [Denitromonas iodatirespirans]|uniref:Com family DNA-binding transcriptional regulator n=1 Tax=Denitromonas iodatirespirans TaxID=2795389 RepID=A0A944D806_DENI1|nr:Com family DNA-binding transcriptional regulator [Denitromonas iodatirespirans]
MKIIRCGSCNRKLGEGIFTALSIKCPRCRRINHLKASSLPSDKSGDRHEGSTTLPVDRRQAPTR